MLSAVIVVVVVVVVIEMLEWCEVELLSMVVNLPPLNSSSGCDVGTAIVPLLVVGRCSCKLFCGGWNSLPYGCKQEQ